MMGHHMPFDKGTENIPILERREESHVWERLVRAPGGGGEGGKELKCTVPTHEKEIHCDWIPKSPLIRAKQRTQSTPLNSNRFPFGQKPRLKTKQNWDLSGSKEEEDSSP